MASSSGMGEDQRRFDRRQAMGIFKAASKCDRAR